MPRSLPLLRGKRVTVRMGTAGDAASIARHYKVNKAHFAPFDPLRPAEFYTERFWRRQVTANRQEFLAGRSLRLFVFERELAIGSVNFTSFVRNVFQACYLGYGLSRDHEGQGYMTEALELSIGYVFGELNMHRIMANYLPENKRSAALLKRLGFEVEGKAREYLLISGKWRDHVMTSLINKEWKPRLD